MNQLTNKCKSMIYGWIIGSIIMFCFTIFNFVIFLLKITHGLGNISFATVLPFLLKTVIIIKEFNFYYYIKNNITEEKLKVNIRNVLILEILFLLLFVPTPFIFPDAFTANGGAGDSYNPQNSGITILHFTGLALDILIKLPFIFRVKNLKKDKEKKI